jgi:hypothetical protein
MLMLKPTQYYNRSEEVPITTPGYGAIYHVMNPGHRQEPIFETTFERNFIDNL